MGAYSSATEQFLLAAKNAEIKELEQLAFSCEVVTTVSDFIHQLQRERGASNIFLGSKCQRFSQERKDQISKSITSEQRLRASLNEHFLASNAGSMRLLNNISFVLHGIDNLKDFRYRCETGKITPLESTQAYCRLIAGLLSIVFEAADVAHDPEITKILVALFNFMQGKEYAGQERAWGAIGFAETHFNASLCERLNHLKEIQEVSFGVFVDFASPDELAMWRKLEKHASTTQLIQLRAMIQRLSDGDPIAEEISEVWYDVASQRIDQMHTLEDFMANKLLKVSASRVTQAQTELHNHQSLLSELANAEPPQGSPLTLLFDPSMPGLHGSDHEVVSTNDTNGLGVSKSFYDLVRSQAEHIKKMTDELNETRRAINDQKQIDRAKRLLMQALRLTEEQAHRRLQKRAMEKGLKLIEVAEIIIKTGEQN